MRKAFVIMAYKDPDQIERLVKRMSHDSFHFYIHVDKKFSIDQFKYLGEIKNVFFTHLRREISWASYTFTKTVIDCCEEMLSRGNYDFVSAFSGQDYPIKDNDYIVNYYSERIGHSFFMLEDENSDWWVDAAKRYKKYHATDFGFKGRYLIQKILNTLLPDRKFDHFPKLYGGPRATWWTMSSDCARYVINYLKEHKKLRRFVRYTWAPDEFLIPSIVMNSEFRVKVINNSGRYIDWSQGGSNPKIIVKEDLQKLLESDKLYARKFDIKVDSGILDQLDEAILGKLNN